MPKQHLPRSLLVASLMLFLSPRAWAEDPKATDADFFENEVRPVLVSRCQKCHGEGNSSKGGLKLTSREAVLEGGESGPAAIEGKPDESPMIEAIRREGLEMPPEESLSEREIASLVSWVKLGLPWPKAAAPKPKPLEVPKHWAFQPVRRPDLPKLASGSAAPTDVDRFVVARLAERGLSLSAAAEKQTLIRRATFDLIGLPPTPEEIDQFVADSSPSAFAKVVERLLASPHYGERWGRYWLDIARYADTRGYTFVGDAVFPWAYTYRDYVIRAFNEDLPYDQFIKEQLAADQLPRESNRPLAAMGFLTVGNRFMGIEQDVIDDRVDCVSRGLLGLTVSCARCHDHKYDPIPTRDYYSLYGVFAASLEPMSLPLLEPPPANLVNKYYFHELARREGMLTLYVRQRFTEIMQFTRTHIADYLLAGQEMRGKPTTENFMEVVQAGDLNPAIILGWRLMLDRASAAHDPVLAPWNALAGAPPAEFEQRAKQLAAQAPASRSRINPLVLAEISAQAPKNLPELGACYQAVLSRVDEHWQQLLARAEAEGALPPDKLLNPDEEELRQRIYPPEVSFQFGMSLSDSLFLFPDRATQAKRDELVRSLGDWRSFGPGSPPRAMVLHDRPLIRPAHVFIRGNSHRPGEVVPRQFLEVIAGAQRKPFAHGSGRLELTEAIVDRRNPLTARVMVNRIWQYHFGAGLVGTPSDFGVRSDPPTHPELLDYLASAFMDEGWSVKRMHRLIMLTAAYQQQSADRPDCRQVDPENKLLWKMNRRRLDWEATRDALLAASGRLDRSIGGPSVKDIVSAESTRRTMYGFLDRLNVPGLFRTFDFPSPDATSPKRDLTTVPQQALFMMNSPFVSACAQRLLERPEVASAPDAQQKCNHIYRLLYGRQPAADEVSLAEQFVKAGGSPPQAWLQYAQALMLSNELVFVD